jgi:site-specific recombinase XerD
LEVDPTRSIDTPKVKQAMPKYLSMDESVKMLENVPENNVIRDFCIITLFLNCGMRLSELVGMNTDDVNFEQRSLRLKGKGNKERVIFINDACVNAMKAYLEIRKEPPVTSPDWKAFFVSRNKKRITNRRVQQIVAETINNAHLEGKGYSPHKLRHTAATLMYQFGDADMLALQQILGHENVSTTQIYTHISNKQVVEVMKKSPLANIKLSDTTKHTK